MKLGVDRLPLVIFAALLIGTLGAGAYYYAHAIIVLPSPELPVWAAYDSSKAVRLIAWAIAGLVLAALVPMGRGQDSGRLAADIRSSAVRLNRLWGLIAIAALGLSVWVKGPYLIRAPAYLMFTAGSVPVAIAGALQPLGVLATGVVSTKRPVLGGLGLLAWASVLFAYSTRVFAGVFALYVVGRWLGGARVKWLTWIAAAISAPVLLPVPLLCRGLPEHGLIPYWAGLRQAVVQPTFFSSALLTVTSNFGFAIPLIIKTSQETAITPHDMLISVNPEPAGMAGWGNIAMSMRIHLFIPYSCLGEWARFGGKVLMGFTFAWGLIVRGCLVRISNSTSPLKVPFLAGVIGIALISSVLSLQYNTRSVCRMIDIIVLFTLAESVVARLFRQRTASATSLAAASNLR